MTSDVNQGAGASGSATAPAHRITMATTAMTAIVTSRIVEPIVTASRLQRGSWVDGHVQADLSEPAVEWIPRAIRVGQCRMLMARARTIATVASATADCSIIASLAQRDNGMVSVGLNAVALVNDT